MNDAELTALAAKAFGKAPETFSPLTDDGDAFRLAVSLNLSFCVGDAYIVIHSVGRPNLVTQQYDGDPYSATRRAIVRAASEIGKAMEDQ